MTLKKLACKYFNKHSCSVFGEKGSGKDVLFGNIIARRRSRYYISNTDYKITNKIFKKKFIRLDLNRLMIDNNYSNFISGRVNQYCYPYPDKVDIYISDCGVIFPSQYNSELNHKYREFPGFMALSRQLGDCYIHTNTQALNRVWDKIREQSTRFINTRFCLVFFGKIVVMKIRVYEKYESALNQVLPFVGRFSFKKEVRQAVEQERIRYLNQHGSIREHWLIFKHKSKFDSRFYRDLLLGGVVNEKREEIKK